MLGFIGSILIGCLAGFIAGKLMKGGGFGCLWNLLLGIAGGVVGGWTFGLLGISWDGTLGTLGTAVIGAVLILWIASRFKK
ncbi:MAG TPA: GlsB/YeaQ/YmgE family stress response membrane protein [Prevotella sp.]